MEPTTSPSNTSATLPLGLGAIAALVAIIALVLALSAQASANKMKAEMEAALEDASGAAELSVRLSQLAQQVDEVSTAHNQLALDIGNLPAQVQSLAQQTQAALNQIGGEITANRQHIAKMGGGTVRPASSTSGGSEAPTTENPGEYRIQSGDTFSGIAQKFGIRLGDLISANPDANPRSLRVGQVVILPQQ